MWGRARVRMRAVSVSVCGRCRFAFVTIYFELDYVCVRETRTALKRCCCSAVCSYCYCWFGWQHLGPISNTQRCHLTHLHWPKVQPYTAHNRALLSAVKPLLRCCCAASAVVVVVSHQRYTVKASATTTGQREDEGVFVQWRRVVTFKQQVLVLNSLLGYVSFCYTGGKKDWEKGRDTRTEDGEGVLLLKCNNLFDFLFIYICDNARHTQLPITISFENKAQDTGTNTYTPHT